MAHHSKINEDTILYGDDMVAAAILLAGRAIAQQISNLGNADAATPFGALEALGKHVGEKLDNLADAIRSLEGS